MEFLNSLLIGKQPQPRRRRARPRNMIFDVMALHNSKWITQNNFFRYYKIVMWDDNGRKCRRDWISSIYPFVVIEGDFTLKVNIFRRKNYINSYYSVPVEHIIDMRNLGGAHSYEVADESLPSHRTQWCMNARPYEACRYYRSSARTTFLLL